MEGIRERQREGIESPSRQPVYKGDVVRFDPAVIAELFPMPADASIYSETLK